MSESKKEGKTAGAVRPSASIGNVCDVGGRWAEVVNWEGEEGWMMSSVGELLVWTEGVRYWSFQVIRKEGCVDGPMRLRTAGCVVGWVLAGVRGIRMGVSEDGEWWVSSRSDCHV